MISTTTANSQKEGLLFLTSVFQSRHYFFNKCLPFQTLFC